MFRKIVRCLVVSMVIGCMPLLFTQEATQSQSQNISLKQKIKNRIALVTSKTNIKRTLIIGGMCLCILWLWYSEYKNKEIPKRNDNFPPPINNDFDAKLRKILEREEAMARRFQEEVMARRFQEEAISGCLRERSEYVLRVLDLPMDASVTQVLGLDRQDLNDGQKVKEAYKKLARVWHPDKKICSPAKERYQECEKQGYFEGLSDKEKEELPNQVFQFIQAVSDRYRNVDENNQFPST
jgi:hypothetical protein